MNPTETKSRKPWLLLLVPLLTYIFSYVYLAIYHGQLNIFNTIVHESGQYTLLETTFFASHFLGHILTHTIIALFFVGVYLKLTGSFKKYSKKATSLLLLALIIFLGASFLLSIKVFGYQDTIASILQMKQRVDLFVEGGYWNLHLPSLILLIFLIPVYIYVVKLIFKRKVKPNKKGTANMIRATILAIIITVLLNDNVIQSLVEMWQDPRYLAHSVRELATFPLTYFPIPLYFFLKDERPSPTKFNKKPLKTMAVLLLIFLALFSYQVYESLQTGISNMAQQDLPITYLLSSHYFEHFLDTIFFTLVCLILFGLTKKEKSPTCKIHQHAVKYRRFINYL